MKRNLILLEVICCSEQTSRVTSWQKYTGGFGNWERLATNVSEPVFDNIILGKEGTDSCYARLRSFKPDFSGTMEIMKWSLVSDDYSYCFLGADTAPNHPFDAVKIFVNTGSYSSRNVNGVGLVGSYFRPEITDSISLGNSTLRWANIFTASGAVSTSDERLKTEISSIDEAVFRAWEKVSFKVFKFISAVKEKGQSARRHIGVIAQEIQSAFLAEGLDAREYGLFCYDEWSASKAVYGPEGELVEPARVAGSIYSIRYEEALALECAYQRWLGEKRDARIAELEARLNEISGNSPAPSDASPDNL